MGQLPELPPNILCYVKVSSVTSGIFYSIGGSTVGLRRAFSGSDFVHELMR